MIEKTILITNPSGLHTRPAKKVVDTAKSFGSEIIIVKDGHEETAKNLLKLMKLGISSGTSIIVRCSGFDEEMALTSIEEVLNSLTE